MNPAFQFFDHDAAPDCRSCLALPVEDVAVCSLVDARCGFEPAFRDGNVPETRVGLVELDLGRPVVLDVPAFECVAGLGLVAVDVIALAAGGDVPEQGRPGLPVNDFAADEGHDDSSHIQIAECVIFRAGGESGQSGQDQKD